MLISLSRNQQRVISLCNNDLSVTRSWPFITHHLRCFLTKGRNCYWERAQPPGSGQCQLQRLGRVCRNNSLVPGHPASTASLAQTESHQTRKGFLVSRTWLSMCLKKAMITTAKKNQTLSTCSDNSKEKLFNFSFYPWSDFSKHSMVFCSKRLERSKPEDILFSLTWNILLVCKAFLPTISLHRGFLNFRFWSFLKSKKTEKQRYV